MINRIRTSCSLQVLTSLMITVKEGCTDEFPQLGMDESYKLNITSDGAILRANQVFFSTFLIKN